MYLIPIILVLNVLSIISQTTRKNKLSGDLAATEEPEEIQVLHAAIAKASRNIVLSYVATACLVLLWLYLLSAPHY